MTTSTSTAPSRGEIITFYSYKGGTGRTMALANVACLLAERVGPDEKILVIDWDLEAPGLHRFFPPRIRRETDFSDLGLDATPGLLDLFLRLDELLPKEPASSEAVADKATKAAFGSISIGDYVLPTDVPGVEIMRAGRNEDGQYPSRVNQFSWEGLFVRAPNVYRDLAEHLAKRFRYVLIDSRTGVTDISGICTSMMPEKLVVVFTPNRQSLSGMKDLVERATSYRRDSDDLRRLAVYPLPSRIEGSLEKLKKLWRSGDPELNVIGYQPLFEQLLKEAYRLRSCDLSEYFERVQIQQTPDYAFGEEIAVRRRGDRLDIQESYRIFVDKLTSGAPPWKVEALPAQARTLETALPESVLRPAALASSEPALVAVRWRPQVFLSYGAEDRDRVWPFADALEAAGFKVWFDRQLPVGVSFARYVEEALDASTVVLVFWSGSSVKSEWVRAEAAEGMRRGALIPVLLDDVTPPLEFRHILAADARRDPVLGLARVTEAVRQRVATAPGETAPSLSVPQSRARQRRTYWLANAAVVAALLAGGFYVAKQFRPTPGLGITTTTPGARVPNFVGLSSIDAQRRALDLKLKVEWTDGTTVYPEFVEGLITRQEPNADAPLGPSKVVRLTVATLTAVTPSVVGMDLTGALESLQKVRLQLGTPELRFVPGATIGRVFEQSPPAGTTIPAGTAVNVVIARDAQLSDFQVGVYYIDDQGETARLAGRIVALIRQAGGDAVFSPQGREFFTDREVTHHEIRYEPETETRVMQQLLDLLATEDFPELKRKPIRSRTENFISVFLAPPGTISLIIEGPPREEVQAGTMGTARAVKHPS